MSRKGRLKEQPRSTIPKVRSHIPGWPREHYNADRTPKMQYKTEHSARRVADMMETKRDMYNELEVYRCQYCGCWHIGHRRLIDTEERQLTLKRLIEGELAMIKHYRDEIKHIANEVIAVDTKIDKLERNVYETHGKLFMERWIENNKQLNKQQL